MDKKAIEQNLRRAALAYPGAYEESPWGERVTKVKGKIFLFVGLGKDGGLGVTTKLPSSAAFALSFPFAQPTGYGLGKSGWVTARFAKDADVPEGLLYEWLEESYRAIAPKTLVKELDARGASGDAAPKPELVPVIGNVLLIGDDKLRLERAKKALGARATVASPDDEIVPLLQKLTPRAVVVDLGRRPDVALEVGVALSGLPGCPVIFAGARDAAMVKRAKSKGVVFKEPPGDPVVLAEVKRASSEEKAPPRKKKAVKKSKRASSKP